MKKELVDRFGRKHDYLRVSVTDRCNLRCVYCMGPEGIQLIDHKNILRYEEIVKVIAAAAELGIERIRLTGGEPLVRLGIEELVAKIAAIPGIKDVAMTTNGILLAEKAKVLKEAGLNRVNISMDSLKPEVYREITRGGDLNKVWAGIKAALACGLSPVKINVVLMKDVNDNEIEDFLRLVLEYPLHLRFIEYMPLDSHDKDWKGKYLPLETVLEKSIALGCPLQPVEDNESSGPAEMYQLPGAPGLVGLIHPISCHFCDKCKRLRLTADGFIKPCLYWQGEFSVLPFLQDNMGLKGILQKALDYKKERHAMYTENRDRQENGIVRGMSKIGG